MLPLTTTNCLLLNKVYQNLLAWFLVGTLGMTFTTVPSNCSMLISSKMTVPWGRSLTSVATSLPYWRLQINQSPLRVTQRQSKVELKLSDTFSKRSTEIPKRWHSHFYLWWWTPHHLQPEEPLDHLWIRCSERRFPSPHLLFQWIQRPPEIENKAQHNRLVLFQ